VTEARKFRFEFPLPMNRGQDTGNGKHRSQMKKKYYKELDGLLLANLLPGPPKLPLLRAFASASVFAHNKNDDDNVMARMKWPQDWLKSRGYISEDKRPYLTWVSIPEQTIDRSGRPAVIIMHIVEAVE